MRSIRLILPFLLVISVLLGAYLYTGHEAFALLPPGPIRAIAWSLLILAFVALPLTIVSRFFYERMPGFETIAWFAFVGFGFITLLFSLFMLRDLALLALSGLEWFWPNMVHLHPWSERSLDLAVLGIGILTAFYGFTQARRLPAVRHVTITIPDLHPDLNGFRIVQLSDLHIGPTIRRPFIAAVVDRANALQPDLIAITGDLADGTAEELHEHAAPLSGLKARHGVFYVTGNHDYYSGAVSWIKELRRLGLQVLLNEHAVLHHKEGSIVVGGVTDLQAAAHIPSHASDPHAAMRGAPAASLRLLLAHQPRSAFEGTEAGFNLVLCGHTHGGQYFPGNLIIRFVQPFAYGLHRHGEAQVYTSRGTGTWGPPLRVGAPSEITEIELQSGPGHTG